jgi:hypothetical protein
MSTQPEAAEDYLDEILVYQKDPMSLRLDLFHEWLKSKQARGLKVHPALAIAFNKYQRYGIAAYVPSGLKKGDVLLDVPHSFILSTRTVSDPMVSRILSTQEFRNMIGLTIAYIYESCKRRNSPFYGYLTSFTCPNVPLFWTTEDQALLKGTDIHFVYRYLDLVS